MTFTPSDIKRFAGLDLAKESIFACVIDKLGYKAEKKFKTDLKDIMELKKWLTNRNVEAVVMEHTGVYTEPVKKVLQENFRLEIVNPADVKRKNKKKTDTEDAWWLAELLLSGTIGKGKRILSSHLEDEKSIEFKNMTRLREKKVKQTTSYKNRVIRIFDRNNLRIMKLFGDNKFTKTALIIYEAIIKEKSWKEIIAEFIEIKSNLSGKEGNSYTRAIKFITNNEEKLEEVIKYSSYKGLPRIDKIELLMNLNQIDILQNYIDLLDNEIEDFVENNKKIKGQRELITSIPGIGITTANQILSEIPEINYFATQKQFSSFTGLVPSVSQSAEVTYIGSITKRGSPHLRSALFQSAKIASMKKESPIGIKFQRIYNRKGKGKAKIAWVAIARHIATLIWCILTRKEKYKAENYKKKEYKYKKRLLKKMTLIELTIEIKRRNTLIQGI